MSKIEKHTYRILP